MAGIEREKTGKVHDFVPVVSGRNVEEAEFFRGLLDSEGIMAVIEDPSGEVIGMPDSILRQGVPVLVPDTQAEQAREVLAEHRRGAGAVQVEEAGEPSEAEFDAPPEE